MAGGTSRPPLVDVSPSEMDELRRMLDDWREWI
jgi:hypothetical protein